MTKMNSWDVFSRQPLVDLPLFEHSIEGETAFIRNGYQYYWIDTVWFTQDLTWSEVKTSLVQHDGYPADIYVREVN